MQQIQLPELDGRIYLYGRVNKTGDVEHTVLTAVNDERLPRELQREWAKSVGGVLMNRIDALVIYNDHRDIVKPAAYWTDDACEWDSAYGWWQYGNYGYQSSNHESAQLRAVAVSRFTA